MLVKDVMTVKPTTVKEKDTLATVADLLYELDVRHIPVVRSGDLVGMISDRDLQENRTPATATLNNPNANNWESKLVRTVMSSGVVSVGPESPISEVVDLMIEHKFSAIPVADELTGKLEGIVSYIDVLRVLQDLLPE